MIQIQEKNLCCGCEACAQICPKQCISLHEDQEGFLYPEVDVSLCIECGVCNRACPMIAPDEPRLPKKAYAAINPDSVIRAKSSSGGIFTMLAEKVLAEGGVVFGVRFDEDWQAIFDYTETIEGLESFRGSKYVQARVGSAFKKVRNFLRKGRMVLFSGTPCQVAALRHFLHNDYDNLICADFICHGVPSPKVWRRYLHAVTQNAICAINDIQFRGKAQGWKRFNFSLSYDKQGQCYNLSSCHRDNHYMRIFLSDVILRPSCYRCQAKEGRSGSDLTIADFWGIERMNPAMDDDKGTSLVLINTNRGADYFRQLAVEKWEASYDEISRYNQGLRSAPMHPKRAWFFSQLDSADNLFSLIDTTLRLPFSIRVKSLPKRLLRKAWHMLRSILGGGKIERYTSSEVSSHMSPSPIPPIQKPRITSICFRSKQNSWKKYHMEITLSDIL